jgi:hypothetical protein
MRAQASRASATLIRFIATPKLVLITASVAIGGGISALVQGLNDRVTGIFDRDAGDEKRRRRWASAAAFVSRKIGRA